MSTRSGGRVGLLGLNCATARCCMGSSCCSSCCCSCSCTLMTMGLVGKVGLLLTLLLRRIVGGMRLMGGCSIEGY